MKKIVFTGGGSAGHIMPNLAIIEKLEDYKIYYLGTNGIEKDIISKYPNITFVEIPAVKLIRSLTPKNLLIPFKLIKSINITKKKLNEIKPNLIFSKGGFVSIPVCFAGSKLNIPIITHESDLTIGLANKIIAKKAKYLCCSFKSTAQKYGKNAIYSGSPVRTQVFKGNKNIVFQKYNINKDKPTILVIGGSLGAKAINEIIWDNLHDLTQQFNIIHIVGKNKRNLEKKSKGYIQLEFVNDIENYFDTADLVISRAGSNTIFELLSLKKPMILIPLPKKSSRGDQILNALDFESQKFASVILQENLTKDTLLKTIENSIDKKNTYIENMEKSNIKDGNKIILDLIKKSCV